MMSGGSTTEAEALKVGRLPEDFEHMLPQMRAVDELGEIMEERMVCLTEMPEGGEGSMAKKR